MITTVHNKCIKGKWLLYEHIIWVAVSFLSFSFSLFRMKLKSILPMVNIRMKRTLNRFLTVWVERPMEVTRRVILQNATLLWWNTSNDSPHLLGRLCVTATLVWRVKHPTLSSSPAQWVFQRSFYRNLKPSLTGKLVLDRYRNHLMSRKEKWITHVVVLNWKRTNTWVVAVKTWRRLDRRSIAIARVWNPPHQMDPVRTDRCSITATLQARL